MTMLTIKGQVTIPKRIRTALALEPGHSVTFEVNEAGEVVLRKADGTSQASAPKADRFEAARGKADIKWRTEDLMALLRD
jgi:AbrB family looped-hinge helix DNA binding protein